MKKGDFFWFLILVVFMFIMVSSVTHEVLLKLTTEHPYLGGFIKFIILA